MKPTRVILIFKSRIGKRRFEEIYEDIAKRLNFFIMTPTGSPYEEYYKGVISHKTRPSIGICYNTKTVTLVYPNLLPRDEDDMYRYQYINVENI